MRSLLFVPGDSRTKMDKALSSGADALLLDLEDAVAAPAKAAAREVVSSFLLDLARDRTRPRILVRINAQTTPLHRDDLAAIIPARPDGVVLPKAEGGADIRRLSSRIAELEADHGIASGTTGILPIATETARGLLLSHTIPEARERLLGVTWGGEDLAADLGAEANRDSNGTYTAPYIHARTMTLLAAAAAEVDAIDAVYTAFRDEAGLAEECRSARRDGFGGKMAIHPAQVRIINEAFSPSPEAVADAREIVAAMAAATSGIATLRGRMIDRPHLRQAERIIARAAGIQPGG